MGKKFVSAFLTFIAMGLLLFGQDSRVLLNIAGDQEVSLNEFMWMYQRTNEHSSEPSQSPESYLDSYINFKLKVRDAEDMGLDTLNKFKKELDEYRNMLLQSYLIPNLTEDDLVLEAYERSTQDLSVSHILLKLAQDASPEDTLKAYEEMIQIRDRILGGSSFAGMARTYSDDVSAKENGGLLNYFTVFSKTYAFETAAYTTPVGEISMPVRSPYGYHLLKVHQKRPAMGMVRIAHIFISSTQDMSPEERNQAEIRIRQAYDNLKKGESFGSQAIAFSEDEKTAHLGGELRRMGVGQMDASYEKAVLGIRRAGDYSSPFKTSYGWHIVKLLEKESVGSFADMEPMIRAKIQRERRLEFHKDTYYAQFGNRYGFAEYPAALKPVYDAVDNTLLEGNWDGAGLQSNETPLLEIGGFTLSVGDFVDFMMENQDAATKTGKPGFYTHELYEQYKEALCYKFEEKAIPEMYPEFNYRLQEFHDGILLFEVMDRLVWSKALSDTIGLKSYFESHRDAYMWKERSDACIVTSTGGAKLEEVKKKYKKIRSGSWDENQLNEKFCSSDSVQCFRLAHVLTESGVYPRIDELNGTPGPGPIYENKNSRGFVILKEVRPPEHKQLNEVRGQVVSDYQKYLEEQWILTLRETYPVTVNRDLLN